jgi:hypothetical protein
MQQTARDQVFISYSHKDTKWREDLEIRLKPHLRDGSIKSWSDKQISPGSQWFSEINSALANTKVAVLLVTPDFLYSDFIHEHELGPLLKEAEQSGVKILWVPVRDSAYKQTALKHYQAALSPDKPLAAMTKPKRDQAWVTICEAIEHFLLVSPLNSLSAVSLAWAERTKNPSEQISAKPLKAPSVWSPYEIALADGSLLIVLPIRPINNVAFCLAKYPITNYQYRKYKSKSSNIHEAVEPCGQCFVRVDAGPIGKWQSGFHPWRNPDFKDDQKPVVCVNYWDAANYVQWVNGILCESKTEARTMLPPPRLWDFAAFGVVNPESYQLTADLLLSAHHLSNHPERVNRKDACPNMLGICDMFGNVWEWCIDPLKDIRLRMTAGDNTPWLPELRGGSFQDDLSRTEVVLPGYFLKKKAYTSHADIGFRMAAKVSLTDLPREVQEQLARCDIVKIFD